MSFLSEWPRDFASAQAMQEQLRHQVRASDTALDPRSAVGVDVSYDTRSNALVAAAVRIDLLSCETIATATVTGQATFPYRPGLLAFRELPVIIKALHKLRGRLEVVVCDGHGLAHPRRFGVASHLGVLLDVPTIGIAKNPPQFPIRDPQKSRGSYTVIYDGTDPVGYVLRTQDDINPVYVSIGHRIGGEEAKSLALRLTPRYRLPETTRAADRLSRRLLANGSGGLD